MHLETDSTHTLRSKASDDRADDGLPVAHLLDAHLLESILQLLGSGSGSGSLPMAHHFDAHLLKSIHQLPREGATRFDAWGEARGEAQDEARGED